MRRCEDDVKMKKMRSCEDEKMRYSPPLLEEPCAQTLSGKRRNPSLRIRRKNRRMEHRIIYI
jgi:hypothetical protein